MRRGMRGRHTCALATVLLALARAYYSGDGHEQEHLVAEAGEHCRERLGHASGPDWMECAVVRLLELQTKAKAEGSDAYFPLVPHTVDPFTPDKNARDPAGAAKSELLKNLLRNYSCDAADGGSPVLRSVTWEYKAPDPCGALSKGSPTFVHKSGFLPAGDELPELSRNGPLTEEQAQAVCEGSQECAGFTFAAATRSKEARHVMHFKSKAENVNRDTSGGQWHTLKRRGKGVDCRPGFRRPPPPALRLRVDVLRESPPVYIVHDFATEKECEHMMNLTIPHMERSVVYGGSGPGASSNYRQSYSVNMYPDYDDESHEITRMVRRKFAFAREVAEYEELIEGEGQEPLNSVYYKDDGDQYRPHCDGQCYGGRYRKGERIATSLTYCDVATRGGYTMFTRTGLKVVPKPRQMLFFGYKLPPLSEGGVPRMDAGHTEHTGCPLREGTKWIATMWYREGMTAEKDWTHFRTGG